MAEAGPQQLLRQLSKQRSSGSEGDTTVSQELELLQCVYLEDLRITRHDSGRVDLLFHVTPSTGEDVNKKYIYLDLNFTLPQMYPVEPADVSVSASRGLSDARLKEIVSGLSVRATSLAGTPMLYELVEEAKDSLTDNNIPCGDCVICLYPFREGQEVTRTDCYHYFHVTCLAQYRDFYERTLEQELDVAPPTSDPTHQSQPCMLECPVCREPISAGSACLEAISTVTPTHLTDLKPEKVCISEAIRHWQQQMARLLQQQQRKGGLIDVSAKDQVIDGSWVRPSSVTTPTTDTTPVTTGVQMAAGSDRHQQPRERERGRGRGRHRRKQHRTYDQQTHSQH